MRLLGVFAVGCLLNILALTFFVTLLWFPSVQSTTTLDGNRAVVQAALQMEDHLSGTRATIYHQDFPPEVVSYWNAICHGCSEMQSGSLQCVMFVLGAYALAGQPLHAWGNAIDFWSIYRHQAGWSEVPTGLGLPHPGDILVWQGGPFGHVAVVVDVVLPGNGHDGRVTVTQANAPGNRFPGSAQPGNWYTMPLHADLSIGTWPGFAVLGFLEPQMTQAQTTLPLGLSWQTPYVQLAWDDAVQAGFSPRIFLRQINQESGFQPQALSSAGAQGIAQFLPATAARLGINSWDSLRKN